MVAIVKSAAWRERVALEIYHLNEDPAPGRRYLPITGATLVVNGSHKITRINAESIQRALEQAAGERPDNR